MLVVTSLRMVTCFWRHNYMKLWPDCNVISNRIWRQFELLPNYDVMSNDDSLIVTSPETVTSPKTKRELSGLHCNELEWRTTRGACNGGFSLLFTRPFDVSCHCRGLSLVPDGTYLIAADSLFIASPLRTCTCSILQPFVDFSKQHAQLSIYLFFSRRWQRRISPRQ